MKSVRSTSIFHTSQPTPASSSEGSSTPSAVEASSKSTEATKPEPVVIDQTSVEVAWHTVAQEIGATDRFISSRMESVVPKLLEQDKIGIEVANQNVEDFFKTNRIGILNGMKKVLGISNLEMVMKEVESSGPARILSPYEQMQKMEEQNPALKKLQETLMLVIK